MKRKVLVTGLGGVVGTAIRPALEERYELIGLGRKPIAGLAADSFVCADIQDRAALDAAFVGVDTVVHLAASGGESDPHADMNVPWPSILENNIVGTYNVFEAARLARVRRVIFASSGATVIGYETELPYRALIAGGAHEPIEPRMMLQTSCEPKPVSLYAVSKLFGEDLARYFAAISPMSVLCLRIGQVRESDRPESERDAAIWCSHGDMRQMVVRCIEAPDQLRFEVLFVTSRNRLGYRDLSAAERAVGYLPNDGC